MYISYQCSCMLAVYMLAVYLKMKINSKFLSYFKLDQSYSLLNCRDCSALMEFFKALDIRGMMALDDVQFLAFMQVTTDLNIKRIYRVFDMLDVDRSGLIDFDEFYVLICILLAVRDNQEKKFILRHSQTVFELLDEDGNSSICAEEFEGFSFLFNFEGKAVRQIFHEFDVRGDQKLGYQDFRMFIVACIDRQIEIEKEQQSREGKRRWWQCNIQ